MPRVATTVFIFFYFFFEKTDTILGNTISFSAKIQNLRMFCRHFPHSFLLLFSFSFVSLSTDKREQKGQCHDKL